MLLIALLGLLIWRIGQFGEHPHPVSTLPLQARVISQVADISSEKLLDNLLTKLDDFGQAVTAANLPLVVALRTGSYGRGQAIVPSMIGVRRMVEECQNGRRVPIAKVRAILDDSVDNYQEMYQRVFVLQRERPKKKIPSSAPFPEFDEWTHKNTYANVAVYLLGELDDFASLPRLVEIWEINKLLPVSRLFILAVMADLARRHPREKLSGEALAALEAFLQDGGKALFAPIPTEVTAWNAPVTETDFRAKIAGTDVGLDRVRKVRLRLYSRELQKYEDVYDELRPPTFGLKPEVFRWFGQMRAFVILAYPPK